MPEPENQTVLYLLIACTGLVLVTFLLIFRVSMRLGRIERLLTGNNKAQADRTEGEEAPPATAETSPGGAFEAFLGEDPSRRELTKNEQFAAYRQWRHENGMNWSNQTPAGNVESD